MTKEEILLEWANHLALTNEEMIYNAMEEYSNQQLSEYKENLKKAIHEAVDDPEGLVDRYFIREAKVIELIDTL